MSFFNSRRKIHKAVVDGNVVDVTELDGVRSLHLGSDTIQSSMRVKDPYELVLAYSWGMMCYLLFAPNASKLSIIGLGGGSLSKYIWKYCSQVQQTVVEINPEVIRIARSHFFLPENDARLNVMVGDGIDYMQDHLGACEVLMIDAFASDGLPPDFCTQSFFDDCEQALTTDGLLAVNLWGSDRHFNIYLQRIQQSFARRVLVLPTGKPGNIIVFGFKPELVIADKATLQARARAMAGVHAVPFLEMLSRLETRQGIDD